MEDASVFCRKTQPPQANMYKTLLLVFAVLAVASAQYIASPYLGGLSSLSSPLYRANSYYAGGYAYPYAYNSYGYSPYAYNSLGLSYLYR